MPIINSGKTTQRKPPVRIIALSVQTSDPDDTYTMTWHNVSRSYHENAVASLIANFGPPDEDLAIDAGKAQLSILTQRKVLLVKLGKNFTYIAGATAVL